jgi:hypothetical protein
MAKWYPNNYLDQKQPSPFRTMYQELTDKGVLFPQEVDYAYIKEKD